MEEFASFLIPERDNVKVKKNALASLNFNEPETPLYFFEHDRECEDTMRIYLRLRPAVPSDKDDCYETPNDHEIVAIPPEESASYRNFISGYGKTSQKFTFSKLFPGSDSQDRIFDETTKSLLGNFIKGSDRLLFTYGTTSSGKTYTMTGNKRSVGIIPRSLISLFNGATLSNDASIMPIDFSEVATLSAMDLQRILREKNQLLKLSEKESSEILNSLSGNNDDSIDVLCCNNVTDYKTTFWITFTEIYNEMIYDLLDVNQCQANATNKNVKRPILDIRTARNGGSYVKGLSCYPAFSAEEAYRLFMVGRRSQKTGATRLNQNSSRSHTIFTIRAVRTTASSQYLTRVSNLSFCDLAGSERTAKAQTSGLSQKEANNINSSLLALGRCIEVLRRNQSNPANQNVVPFRDSKLTRLFQTYLTGNGTASMIVCVNPDRQLFDETIQVLKFSAIARKVVLQEKEKVELVIPWRKSHFSRLGLNTPKKSSSMLAWDSDNDLLEEGDTLQEDDDDDEDLNVEELLVIIEKLKDELLTTKKEKIANEARIIDRLNEEWTKKILKMENDHSDRIQEVRDQMNLELLKLAKTERKYAYAQLKKRRVQYESSDDEEKVENELTLKLTAKEKECNAVAIKCKEAEEESVEARAIVDDLAKEMELLRIRSKQLEFQVATVNIELKKYRQGERKEIETQTECISKDFQDFSNCSIVTIEADTSLRSSNSSMSSSRFNRFSSFTSDPRIRVQKNMESHIPAEGFFGPVQSPHETFKLKETDTVKRRINEIPEEYAEDDSFLDHEADAKIIDLESRVQEKEEQLKKKDKEVAILNEQLESVNRRVSTSAKEHVKEVMVLNNRERFMNITIDAIAKNMNLLPSDNATLDVPKKLELILTEVKQQQRRLEPLKESLSRDGSECGSGQENSEPARVTRSRVIDGKSNDKQRRTRRKK